MCWIQTCLMSTLAACRVKRSDDPRLSNTNLQGSLSTLSSRPKQDTCVEKIVYSVRPTPSHKPPGPLLQEPGGGRGSRSSLGGLCIFSFFSMTCSYTLHLKHSLLCLCDEHTACTQTWAQLYCNHLHTRCSVLSNDFVQHDQMWMKTWF